MTVGRETNGSSKNTRQLLLNAIQSTNIPFPKQVGICPFTSFNEGRKVRARRIHKNILIVNVDSGVMMKRNDF